MKNNYQRLLTQLGMLHDMGYSLEPGRAVVLDLGCGNGELVNEYLKKGYDAFGCDFKFKAGKHVDKLVAEGRLSKIDSSIYRLPFDDERFDFVLTDQVFEHVRDYAVTLSEIKRVLKPVGVSLNFFPSRYQIIEPHVFVPFASIFKNYYWLLLWAFLGIRKPTQKGFTARETAQKNLEYLKNRTFYFTKSDIKRKCKVYFRTVRFAEDIFIKHIRRFTFLSVLSNISIFPWLYSAMRHRVLVLMK